MNAKFRWLYLNILGESDIYAILFSKRLCEGECFYKSFTENVMNWARPWRAGWNGERLKAENKHKVFAMA